MAGASDTAGRAGEACQLSFWWRNRLFLGVFATLCALALTIAAHEYLRAHREENLLKSVRGAEWDENQLIPGFILSAAPESIAWQLWEIGKWPCGFYVHSDISDFGDEDLAPLSQLTLIESVCLHRSAVTDDGLSALAGLRSLKRLEFYESQQISDDGLKRLPPLRFLEILDLSCTRVSSDGLQCLAPLPRLRELRLSATKVDDSILYLLSKCRKLEVVDLAATTVRGDRLDLLSSCSRLRVLSLSGTEFTEESIRQIVELKSLEELNLECTNVGYSGLTILKQLPRLQIVRLLRHWKAGPTLSEIEKLENEMPGVTFIY